MYIYITHIYLFTIEMDGVLDGITAIKDTLYYLSDPVIQPTSWACHRLEFERHPMLFLS